MGRLGRARDSAQASADVRPPPGRSNDFEHLLRDNYETPYYAPELAGSEFELQQLEMILKLSVDDFKSPCANVVEPG